METANGTMIITNGHVIDGTGALPSSGITLVVQNGRISYVGPGDEMPQVPPEAKRIDARGGTIMPGLVTGKNILGTHCHSLNNVRSMC